MKTCTSVVSCFVLAACVGPTSVGSTPEDASSGSATEPEGASSPVQTTVDAAAPRSDAAPASAPQKDGGPVLPDAGPVAPGDGGADASAASSPTFQAGRLVTQVAAQGAGRAMQVEGDSLYVGGPQGRTVLRIPLDGSPTTALGGVANQSVNSFAVDATYVYGCSSNSFTAPTLWRVPRLGGATENLGQVPFVKGGFSSTWCNVALNTTDVFMATPVISGSYTAIFRWSKSNTGALAQINGTTTSDGPIAGLQSLLATDASLFFIGQSIGAFDFATSAYRTIFHQAGDQYRAIYFGSSGLVFNQAPSGKILGTPLGTSAGPITTINDASSRSLTSNDTGGVRLAAATGGIAWTSYGSSESLWIRESSGPIQLLATTDGIRAITMDATSVYVGLSSGSIFRISR